MPHSNIEPTARSRAQTLRRERTKAEQAMWDMLRDLRPYGARFRRETPVGPYIADFAWLSARLIVEVDGDRHETLAGRAHDITRDAFLKEQGFTVLRFDNDQVVQGPDYVYIEVERHVRHLLKGYEFKEAVHVE
jgi:very-short-patch-repair endonuclease